ncbi:MAG: YggT family protein [Acidimicrobiales bacterium]
MLRDVVIIVLEVYLWGVLLPRALLSWFPVSPGSWLVPINTALYRLSEPVLAPVRRVIPPLSMGGTGLDLSFFVVFLGIQVIVIPLVASL